MGNSLFNSLTRDTLTWLLLLGSFKESKEKRGRVFTPSSDLLFRSSSVKNRTRFLSPLSQLILG